jgi:hypothetical protein
MDMWLVLAMLQVLFPQLAGREAVAVDTFQLTYLRQLCRPTNPMHHPRHNLQIFRSRQQQVSPPHRMQHLLQLLRGSKHNYRDQSYPKPKVL